VATMVRAAAKEPAIVAVAMALFEFIGRSPKIRMLRSRVSTQRRRAAGGGLENPAAHKYVIAKVGTTVTCSALQ
jgi:hypothetical protein